MCTQRRHNDDSCTPAFAPVGRKQEPPQEQVSQLLPVAEVPSRSAAVPQRGRGGVRDAARGELRISVERRAPLSHAETLWMT